jgi:hypothetical protein
MRTIKAGAIFILIHLVSLQSFAQKIDSILNNLAVNFPAEKIYIHYDKEYYVAVQ